MREKRYKTCRFWRFLTWFIGGGLHSMELVMVPAMFKKAYKTWRFFDIFDLQCSKKLIKPVVFWHFRLAMFQKAYKTCRFLTFLICDNLAVFQKAYKTCRFLTFSICDGTFRKAIFCSRLLHVPDAPKKLVKPVVFCLFLLAGIQEAPQKGKFDEKIKKNHDKMKSRAHTRTHENCSKILAKNQFSHLC